MWKKNGTSFLFSRCNLSAGQPASGAFPKLSLVIMARYVKT